MNDHELDLALADLGATRVQPTAPPMLRQRIDHIALPTRAERSWLPPSATLRVQSLFGATRLVAAGIIVALFGGILLTGVLTLPRQERVPAVGSTASADPAPSDASTAAPEPTGGPGSFRPAGTMSEPRANHTATLLPDGRVLVVGGVRNLGAGNRSPSAEIWDPATESFEPAGTLVAARSEHTATLLDDGRVLIIGGARQANGALMELWDPSTGAFEPGGRLGPPAWHTATKLPDGRVFAIGAADYGPKGRVWDPTTEMSDRVAVPPGVGPRHTATLLLDGRLLIIAGGEAFAGLIGDPATSALEPVGSGWAQRREYAVTLLSDGRVLVIGGIDRNSKGILASTQLWDPTTESFDPHPGSLSDARDNHTATLLPDGRVLVVGGNHGEAFASAEVWDPATSSFGPAASLAEGRVYHTATRLADGRVLVIGGRGVGGALASAEIWEPGDGAVTNQ